MLILIINYRLLKRQAYSKHWPEVAEDEESDGEEDERDQGAEERDVN